MAESAAPGTCVRSRGEEFRRGQELLPAGRILSAADIGLLASAGIAKVQVNRRIKVAYCSTGDELTPPGQPLEAGKIYESNRYMLSALLAELGAESTDLGVLPDRFDDLVAALESAAASADAIVSTGGASVGEADYVVRALEQCGKVEFWKVAIKPGKPFAFGKIGSAWYFGLPGNPVAVIVTFQQLVAPALRRLMGAHPSTPLRFSAVAADRIKKSRGRMEFQRGIYHRRADGSFQVVSLENQGSHRLSSVTEANCFIVLPAENQGVAAGELVEIEPFSTRL
jgi:molybdopterin molybdotransferase